MFTGRRYDSEAGLYYYRARYYAHDIGRFLQIDPIVSDRNLYRYCLNNPINWTDPMGLKIIIISATAQASFMASGVRESGIVIGEGKIGWINTTGGGGGTPSAGLGISLAITNAKSINQLSGIGGQGGMSGGLGLTLGVDVIVGDRFAGTQATLGAGVPIPLEGHGQITRSTVYEWFDYGKAISGMKNWYKGNIYNPLYSLGYNLGNNVSRLKNWYNRNIYDLKYNKECKK